MTTRTRQAIVMISFLAAMIAGIASEIAIREQIGTAAGYVPVTVMICTFVITVGVLNLLAGIVKRNNP